MLKWFASDPARYWTISWFSFGLVLLAALAPLACGMASEKREKVCLRRIPPWCFALLLALSFVAFRWPVWFVPEELNPDESQLIAGAITLQHDPIYWRAIDGTTHGPLDGYALLVGHWCGLSLNYLGARIVGSALVVLLIVSCYRFLAAVASDATARVAVLPIFCFFAFCTCWDLVHYSSEYVPATLLAVGASFLIRDVSRQETRHPLSWRWILGGILLGAVPFGKLQGGPIAAALLAVISLSDLCISGVPLSNRIKRTVVLVVSALIPMAVIVGSTYWAGSLDDAWKSYIVQNVRYSGDKHHPVAELLAGFWNFARLGEGFYEYSLGCFIIIALCALRVALAPARFVRFAAVALVFAIISLAVVLTPGRLYGHYLLFLVAPAGLLAGVLWQICWQSPYGAASSRRDHYVLLVLFLSLALFPQVRRRVAEEHPYLRNITAYQPSSENPVAKTILTYASPGEPLGMWGWMSRYYVYTQMRQATHEAHSVQQIQSSPQFAYYRERYLADLKRTNPPVFVDAVGPGNFVFQDRSLAHESFPELDAYISQRYTQVTDLQGARIYVRNDRVRAVELKRKRS